MSISEISTYNVDCLERLTLSIHRIVQFMSRSERFIPPTADEWERQKRELEAAKTV